MANHSVETELLDLEKRYWDAIKDKDAVVATQLSHDPCIVTGAQGVSTLDRESLARMMEQAPWTLDDFELENVQVQLVRDDVAIVAYTVKESLIVDGRPLTLEAADSSTWVRANGRWLCALHTESIAGDPFGRH
jgi:uncharacterized protein (TIGR02246 family)